MGAILSKRFFAKYASPLYCAFKRNRPSSFRKLFGHHFPFMANQMERAISLLRF